MSTLRIFAYVTVTDNVRSANAKLHRLSEAFPGVRIRAFAVIRIISRSQTFKAIYDPCVGNVTLAVQETFRGP